MTSLANDVRNAIRQLRRSPSFCFAAIVILALSIGANAAMFSLENAIVLRKLPIPNPDSLIGISGRSAQDQLRLTPIPAIDVLKRDAGAFRDLCGINSGVVLSVASDVAASQAIGALVTGRCFETIGVAPILGRTIVDEDAPLDRRGNLVTVISHRLWMRIFGGEPSAIGKRVRVEGAQLTVIGVMPQGFDGVDIDAGADLYVPFDTIFPARTDRRPGAAYLLTRTTPDASVESIAARITTVWPALLNEVVPATVPAAERASLLAARPRVESLGTGLSGYRSRYAKPVAVMFGLSGILLILACVNLGGLLLSRSIVRSPEMAMRLALGGGRVQMARQLLIENALVGVCGAVVAVPVSFAIVNLVASFLPTGNIARTLSLTPDAFVIAITLIAGLTCSIVIAVLPIAIALPRRAGLVLAWHRTTAGPGVRWMRGLLAAQIALSVVLVIGAALLGRSLYLLHHVDQGVAADRLLMIRLMPLPDGYSNIDNASYYPALLDRIGELPGVESVAIGRAFPRMFTDAGGQAISVIGEPDRDLTAFLEITSPAFFDTLGLQLLNGRATSWSDNASSRKVAVVSERLAKMLSPDGAVIGRRVNFGTDPIHRDVEIVGIVRSATMGNPRNPAAPVFYRPALQAARYANYPSVLVRGDSTAFASISAAARAIVADAGHEFIPEISTVEEVLNRAPASERMSATLAATLGALAIILTFVGTFAVLAYDVTRRTREIGVRCAIGAEPRQVMQFVLREAMLPTIAGVVIGLPVAYSASRVLAGLLFGIRQSDPLTFGGAAVFFVALGLVAASIPARRAATIDPVIALRIE